MSDIVDRLRNQTHLHLGESEDDRLDRQWDAMAEAADEIERLRKLYDASVEDFEKEIAKSDKEIERLREALYQCQKAWPTSEVIHIAAEALKQK